jgi:hypothetical protein
MPQLFCQNENSMKVLHVIKSSIVIPDKDAEWVNEIPKDMKLRAPRIWRMARVAVDRLLKDLPGYLPKSIVSATALGALDETRLFLDGIYTDGFGSPKSFIASVHNSMAGKLGIDFGIRGPNLTVCDGQNSFASALSVVSVLKPEDFPCILLVIDEKTGLLKELHPHFSNRCKKSLEETWEEAAVAFLLDINTTDKKPALSAAGPAPLHGRTPETCIGSIMQPSPQTRMLPLKETSSSFVKPAVTVHALVTGNNPGTYSVGSFSPSAHTAAVVTVCL